MVRILRNCLFTDVVRGSLFTGVVRDPEGLSFPGVESGPEELPFSLAW